LEVGVVVVDLWGGGTQLVLQPVRVIGTGGCLGDIKGNLDWEVEAKYQPVHPNLAFIRVRLHIQDLLDLDLDLVQGVAKILLEIEDFLML
jgi:hypothetical protein